MSFAAIASITNAPPSAAVLRDEASIMQAEPKRGEDQ